MTFTALVTIARAVLLLAEIALAVPALYLLVVTLSAMWASYRIAHAPKPALDSNAEEWPRLAVLIPAHNEELLIGRLLDSLARVEYPRDRLGVYVIADNCDDATATVARAATWAHTLERTDTERRGKGYALVWGLGQLASLGVEYDACAIIDADSVVEERCLLAMADVLRGGAVAVQARDTVLNSFESPSTCLRWLALELMNHVRQLGRSRLGASATLAGNGMLLRRELLERYPWRAFGLTEDYQYYLGLIERGERVEYAPDAVVRSDMPTTFDQMRLQDIRWESDDTSTWATSLRLLRAAARERSILPFEAVIELLTPPLSMLVGGSILLLLVALVLGWAPTLALALVIMACVGVYISSTLVLERPPLAFYRGMLYAPMYLCWKLWVTVVAVRIPRRSREWVRTARAAPDQ
ncbi:MAG TPA: glycosyltransferase family 2 protein [Ktedonobacterales bacterium]|jgi:cellulose synthase/poly-beta-1,6-N-acetylglucosamine synthase-like glycosyltransferase|nr:glycosyltransferase family 2 protein [Ktedonobacterales bacterium]